MAFNVPGPDERERDPVGPNPIVSQPRNVRVDVLDRSTGTFRVRWLDHGYAVRRQFPILNSWRVIYCSTELAGNPTAGEQWARRVMQTGLGIHETPINGQGQELEYIHADPTLGDGWVVVVGVAGSLLGYPSEPAFVQLESSTSAISADVTNPAVSYSFQTTKATGYDVMKISASYYSPADMTNFHGVHIHTSGYLGVGKVMELDSPHVFQSKAGGQKSSQWIFHIPQDSGLGSGQALFTDTSAAVLRVSGSPFTAAMVTRRMIVNSHPGGDTWFDSAVFSFTDADHITMTSPFNATTGVYNWVVLNQITFYFVAISVRGSRRADFTLSPSVTI